MKHNPSSLLIENLKEEGLNIVDKRGIPFENEAERNMLWEGHVLYWSFREMLNDCEYISDCDYWLALQAFCEDMGLEN